MPIDDIGTVPITRLLPLRNELSSIRRMVNEMKKQHHSTNIASGDIMTTVSALPTIIMPKQVNAVGFSYRRRTTYYKRYQQSQTRKKTSQRVCTCANPFSLANFYIADADTGSGILEPSSITLKNNWPNNGRSWYFASGLIVKSNVSHTSFRVSRTNGHHWLPSG